MDARTTVRAGHCLPAMVDRAREKLPEASLRPGRLEALPVEKGSVDLVVCGLALTHVEDLTPVFAEFARVLRPRGQLITSDTHPVVTSTVGMAATTAQPFGGC